MTTAVNDLLEAHPAPAEVDRGALAACIEECMACAQACTACADACLAEQEVGTLRRCIRTDADCADLCETTGRVLSRQATVDIDVAGAVLRACAAACSACAQECEQHASMHTHCRLCAERCRTCEAACRRLLDSLADG
ncbi:hypothetical protein [Streptomyces sulphureus]|uniref:hypothetical protein n=1 Tax=Streptomyces sulphureus TaxID=47758 RepID=UPI0003818FBA|nr:hypothetical protein [Streptomyces sulphureus]